MGEWILAKLSFMPDWLQMLLLSAIPLTELRASIPIAFTLMKDAWGWSWWQIYALAVAGNMLPVPFILWFLDPVSRFLSRWGFFRRFFDGLFERARRRAGLSIEKYEALGLAVFVAIPLPMTGAWSGCVAAYLFGIPARLALPSILLGVAGAGAIVTLIMTGALAGLGFLVGS
jgi:uncharacterized membrane protein